MPSVIIFQLLVLCIILHFQALICYMHVLLLLHVSISYFVYAQFPSNGDQLFYRIKKMIVDEELFGFVSLYSPAFIPLYVGSAILVMYEL